MSQSTLLGKKNGPRPKWQNIKLNKSLVRKFARIKQIPSWDLLCHHLLVYFCCSEPFGEKAETGKYTYTGAGHIIRISSKSLFISVFPFKKWKLYNVYIHSTQTDIFQVFVAFHFYDYNWQLMKTPNSVSQKIRILWKGPILKTPGATL